MVGLGLRDRGKLRTDVDDLKDLLFLPFADRRRETAPLIALITDQEDDVATGPDDTGEFRQDRTGDIAARADAQEGIEARVRKV